MSINLVDTHCHIHDPEFSDRFEADPDQMIENAKKDGVNQLICIGTDVHSSKTAVEFCKNRGNCYPTVAIHPHDAAEMTEKQIKSSISELEDLIKDGGVIGVGETGLDYFYHDDPETHKKQEKLLRLHLELAVKYKLPVAFHVRDQKDAPKDELGHAFAHFFEIIEDYPSVKGVMHSFSAGLPEMEGAVKRGFFIGLNGIMTFTKSGYQIEAAKTVPTDKLLLETDAPFLTPAPFRGKMCEPKHVRVTAEFLANLRGESLDKLAEATTANAKSLFGLNKGE